MENNVKKRMYKKGKFWVVATVTTLALGSALSVQADDSSAAADADTSQADKAIGDLIAGYRSRTLTVNVGVP